MAAFDLVLAPLLPLGALTPLALAALLLALFGIWRRARGGWLRLVFSAVMLLLLLNPAFLREQREPLQDIALVVLDRSPSQDLGKRREQTDVAFTELEKKISALPDTQLRVIEASGSESAGEEGTFLFQEIRRVLAEVSRDQVGAIFIVSDGQVHDAPETAEALGIDAPLHLLR